MIPNEVFHYTTNCKALKILISKQLRLGQLEFTNDPKESKLWVGSLEILGVKLPNLVPLRSGQNQAFRAA